MGNDPLVLAYRFARESGPFSWPLFDGYLHGYMDGRRNDRRWLDACAFRNDYEKAVWCGFHDAIRQEGMSV